jgi:SAM-dependent methyltransferase
MTKEHEYILGTDRDELRRLELQHEVWLADARAICTRAGFAPGHTLLDLGCGPGYASFELAHIVGPTGKIIARDKSAGVHDVQATIGYERITAPLPFSEAGAPSVPYSRSQAVVRNRKEPCRGRAPAPLCVFRSPNYCLPILPAPALLSTKPIGFAESLTTYWL